MTSLNSQKLTSDQSKNITANSRQNTEFHAMAEKNESYICIGFLGTIIEQNDTFYNVQQGRLKVGLVCA